MQSWGSLITEHEAVVKSEREMAKIIATNIKSLCDTQHVTKSDLTRKCGISSKTFNTYIADDDPVMPTANALRAMASYFNVPVDYLLKEPEERCKSAIATLLQNPKRGTYSEVLQRLIELQNMQFYIDANMLKDRILAYFFKRYLNLQNRRLDQMQFAQWVHWITHDLNVPLVSETANRADVQADCIRYQPNVADIDGDREQYNLMVALQDRQLVSRLARSRDDLNKG